jgi:hypothetical protein
VGGVVGRLLKKKCFSLTAESLCTGTVLRTKLALDNCIADYHINERYIRTNDRETGSVGSTVSMYICQYI